MWGSTAVVPDSSRSLRCRCSPTTLKLALANFDYNYQNAVCGCRGAAPSEACRAILRRRPSWPKRLRRTSPFRSIIRRILRRSPSYSAVDVMDGRIGPAQLSGKQRDGRHRLRNPQRQFLRSRIRTRVRRPGPRARRRNPEGRNAAEPWLVARFSPGVDALRLCAQAQTPSRSRVDTACSACSRLLTVPIPLEANLIFVDITPALFVLMIVSSVLGWRRYRQRGLVNPISNLPNLSALRSDRDGRKQALVAARILNYEEIVATLPPNSERQLDRADRRAADSRFAATAPCIRATAAFSPGSRMSSQPFGNHLDALYALFRNPARVAGLSIDLSDRLRRRGRQRTLAREPPRQRPRRRRRSRARRPQVEISRSRKRSRMRRGSCRCSASSTKPSTAARCGSPISPSSTSRRAGSSAPRRSRAGPTPKRARSPRPSSLPLPKQHNRIGKLTDFVLEQGGRRRRADQQARRRFRHRGQPFRAAADATRASPCACRRCSRATGLHRNA